jgi:hypothetical protein
MTTLLQAKTLTLLEVEQQFNLQETPNPHFLSELDITPNLTDAEKQWLDQIKDDFLSLRRSDPTEEIVKLAILAPLLSLAGLSRYPFVPIAEQSIDLTIPDDDLLIRGRIDVLVFYQNLWAIVIEAKRHSINAEMGIPQALTYLMASPNPLDRPRYAFILNGTEFLFLKLALTPTASTIPPTLQYATSDLLTLKRHPNDLYTVLATLKHLRHLILQP